MTYATKEFGLSFENSASPITSVRTWLSYFRIVALLSAIGFLTACDDMRFPRDPKKTLETVLAEGVMTVAFTENRPWITFAAEDEPQGLEADLVRAFAEELGVSINWKHPGAFAALKGLERGGIDLAVGGFGQKDVTPVKGAAPTFTFFEEVFLVGVRPGASDKDDIEGRKVYVPRDLPLRELVKSEGGIPVAQWSDEVNFAIVPHWRLEPWNLQPTGIELHRAKHVMAVQQGENAWLMWLERFLRREQDSIGRRLRKQAQ